MKALGIISIMVLVLICFIEQEELSKNQEKLSDVRNDTLKGCKEAVKNLEAEVESLKKDYKGIIKAQQKVPHRNECIG